MIFVVMLGMGATLTARDLLDAVKRPKALIAGLLAQFGFLPLIALCLALVLPLSDEMKIGLIILGCMPGGTTSNMFTYFARADLALSVLMTVNSTVVGVLAIPLLVVTYLSALQLTGQTLTVPTGNIVMTIMLLLLPVLLGIALRKWRPAWGIIAEKAGSVLGVVFIVVLVATWVPRNWQFLMTAPLSVYAAAIGVGAAGFLAGYVFSAALGLGRRISRTIALEIGIQNGPLAIAIVALSFTGVHAPMQQQVMTIPTLYALFIIFTAGLLTLYFRARPLPPDGA